MDRRGLVAVAAVALVAVAFFLLGSPAPPTVDVEANCSDFEAPYEVEPGGGGYNRTTVALYDPNGTRLATVAVRIADTPEKRQLGLSDTASLPDGEGMLFVHPEQARQVYVMRRMSFPLDIVFVERGGTITTIHHAPVPEEIPGGNGRFPGVGKYVLEVPRGATNATGADVGDCVAIPDGVTS